LNVIGGPLLPLMLLVAVDMKARSMFVLSSILMVGALLMMLKGRGQLNEAFQAWHSGDHQLFEQFARRGRWFLFPAWALAAAGAACLFVSYRRGERAARWTVVVLLVLFVLFGLAPV
jgi:hypothetical protein